MIIDKLENLAIYKNIPPEVIAFLQQDLPVGRYEISDGIWANVEKYQTKPLEVAKYEAHKKYIDIQLLKSGKEYIYVRCAEELSSQTGYNEKKDIEFFSNKLVAGGDKIVLDGKNFVMLFPHEAHAPQVCVNDLPEDVLKVVVKVLVR